MNYRKLKAEISGWISDGIISPSQGETILARYDGEVPLYKKMSFWLQCLAATLAGLALFLVISENWQRLGWAMQSIITALPLIGAQLFALWQERRQRPMAAEVGWFFASLALGANIMLQAQIFHISAYYPNGVLFWVIGILPVIWLRASTVTYLLAAVLFVVYLMMQLQHNQFATISLLPLAVLSIFAWSKQKWYTFLPLLAVVYFFLLTLLEKWDIVPGGFIWNLSFTIFAVALLQQFSELAENWLRRILLLMMLFTGILNMLMTFKYIARYSVLSSVSVVALMLVGVSLLVFIFQRNKLREKHLTFILSGNILVTILCMWLQRYLNAGAEERSWYFIRIAENVVYLGAVTGVLFHAIAARAKALFLGAVMALLAWALIRYLDLFSNYLITALIFILSAVALVLMNKMWEKKYEA